MSRVCKLLIFLVIIAVPFRNVFTAALPEALGLLAKEVMLVLAAFVALQVLILSPDYRRKLGSWLRTPDVQMVLLFAAYVLILCLICLPRSPMQAFLGVAVYLAYTVLFGLALLFLSSGEIECMVRKVLMWVFPIVSVGALLSLVSGWSLVATQEIAYLGVEGQDTSGAFRATSFTGASLHLGLYNAMLLPLVFAYLIHRDDESRGRRWWMLGVFLLGMVSLVVSFSRGAWMQSFVGVLAVAVVSRRKLAKHAGVWVLLGLACMGVLIWRADSLALYWQRFTSITDWVSGSGNVSRIETWKLAFGQFVDSGFLGYGPAATGNAAARLNLGQLTFVTESSYLKLLLELGAVGFVLFVLLYLRFVTKAARLVGRVKSPRMTWLLVGILGSLIGLGVEMATYQSIETQIVQALMWFYLAAIAVAWRELAAKEQDDVTQP